MWGYPWLTWLVIVAIVVVIGSMAFVDDVRVQLWWSLGSLAVVLAAYAARARFGSDHAPRDRAPRFAREDEPAITTPTRWPWARGRRRTAGAARAACRRRR